MNPVFLFLICGLPVAATAGVLLGVAVDFIVRAFS